MLSLLRTDSDHPDLLGLVKELDDLLHEVYGDAMNFYGLHNGMENIRHVVIAYRDDKPVGTGALKTFQPGVLEIKRMFVTAGERGRGTGAAILTELETWATELGAHRLILETGDELEAAVRLYERMGFTTARRYGPYADNEASHCFEKWLTDSA